jgi:hypothetical protein
LGIRGGGVIFTEKLLLEDSSCRFGRSDFHRIGLSLDRF